MAYSLIKPNSIQTFELDLEDRLGRGATADVYKVSVEGVYYALKIYKKPGQINWSKLTALTEMRDDQEFSFVKTHAWPLGIVQKDNLNIGFAMELFDLELFKTVDHYYDNILRAHVTDTRLLALPNLVLIAKNLSIELAKFHLKNIYLVDIKPQNIAINTLTNEVIILDCDGFSFEKDSVKYPADFVSADYIAPEVTINKLSPKTLGIEQDLYALSVLIFQILNRGLHPYSGVSKIEINGHTNDDRATLFNYAYGEKESWAVIPHVSSLHQLWEVNILSTLESCFTGGKRASAAEWVEIFESIERTKGYVRCNKFKQNPLHIRFRDKECLQCKLDSLQVTHNTAPNVQNLPPEPFIPPRAPPVQPQKMSGFAKFLLASVLVLIVWAFLKNDSETTSRRTNPAATIVIEGSKTKSKNCLTDINFCDQKILCKLAVKKVNGKTVWNNAANYSGFVQRAKKLKLNCGVASSSKPSSTTKVCASAFSEICSDTELCSRATDVLSGSIQWASSGYKLAYVEEAKKRGLGCGVKLRPSQSSTSPLCNSNYPGQCTDIVICGLATNFKSGSRNWRLGRDSSAFVKEAKTRRLHCGVTDEEPRYFENTDFLGNDFDNAGIRGVSFAGCVNICKGRENCKGISYVDEKKWCWPKRAMNDRSIKTGITSLIIRQ